jgi:methyl-accepting chemotaxis protein
MNIRNISIKYALIGFAIIVAGLFSTVGLISYLTVGSFGDTLGDSASNTTLLRNSSQLLQRHEATRSDVLAYLIAYDRGNIDWLERIRKEHEQHVKGLMAAIAAIEKSSMSVEIKTTFQAARDLVLAFSKESDALIALTTTDITTVMGRMNEYDTKFAAVSAKLDALSQAIEKENLSFESDAKSAVVKAATAVTMAVLLGLAALGAVGWWLYRHISRPVQQLLTATEDLRAGEADLTKKLPAMSGEFGGLSTSMNGFVGQLHDLIAQVAINASEIATAARQISAGNTDLSARTEEQASTLEETASSMEQFTSSVKQNAENTKLASGLALSASDAAQKGGRIAAQAVAKITAANASSRKISDIVATIDSIAFQTNILALNAAVEAARAGEQGRGFAVVAGEVRALAQRSAASAKEIKVLIGTAVDQVEEGAKLVGEAGSAMQNIMVGIQQVSEIIDEISTASAEQSSGIEQVNRAVMQMEDVTQQNAALVEQAAAAAESMREQAESLSRLVSRFKLNDQRMREDAARARRAAALSATPNPGTAIQIRSKPNGVRSLPATDDGEWTEF